MSYKNSHINIDLTDDQKLIIALSDHAPGELLK